LKSAIPTSAALLALLALGNFFFIVVRFAC
jgi:hypothetical protein